MSEFKFACPVCGQHITADSSATGSPLDCPTCFRKIVVPQAPSSSDPKFVLSASEVTRPRSMIVNPAVPSEPAAAAIPAARSPLPLIITALVVFVLAAGAAVYLFKEKFEKEEMARVQAEKLAAQKVEAKSQRRMPTGTNVWSLDLTEAQFPAETAFGRIHGEDFVGDRSTIQGGTLNLRMGREAALSVSIALYAKQAEELSGKSAVVTTNNIRSPRVVMRWKEGAENKSEAYTNGFALKVEFGLQKGNRLPGKIYLCLPDENQSCVAGVFNAEIRKPSPPKPKPGP